MTKPLPLFAMAIAVALLVVRCQTTQPLPELLADGGSDAGVTLRIDTASLSNGIPEVPYLERLQASGGVRPLTWTLDQRPATGFTWLQFNSEGAIYGMPTRLETGSLTVSVRDAKGAQDSVSLPLSVVTCDEGAQYPCEIGNAGTCEVGIQTCSGGTVSGCGSLTPSTSVLGCGPSCGACDPLKADHCADGGSCACGDQGTCTGTTTCCPGDGCANLTTDAAHCRTCDNDCFARAPQHMDAGCGADDCTFTCELNYQDCQNGLTDGCESPRLTDRNHCGSCANDCTKAANISDAGCSSGACTLVCYKNPGAGVDDRDCDQNVANGCETNIERSSTMCGGCNPDAGDGVDCTKLPHVSPSIQCTSYQCNVDAGCAPNWSNCNTDPKDGCETETDNNPNACGPSCVVCKPPLTGGTAACQAGSCTVACNAGYDSCGSTTNCYNLDTDEGHCGGCVDAGCSSGQVCFAGQCCPPSGCPVP